MKQPIWHPGDYIRWGAKYYEFDPSQNKALPISPGDPLLLVENEPERWFGLPFPILMKFDRVEKDEYGPYNKDGEKVDIDSNEKLYCDAPKNFSKDEVLISVGMSYRSCIHYWIIGKDAVYFEEPIIMNWLRVPRVVPVSKGRNYQTGNLNLSQDGRIVFGEDLEKVLRETNADNYLRWMKAKRKSALLSS